MTTVQELIKELEFIKDNQCKSLREVVFFNGVIGIIESGRYIEKERKQIEDAWSYGYINGQHLSFETGKKYYNKTFKS